MYSSTLVAALTGAVLVSAQGPPPPPVLLTSTQSSVLPVAPTPFAGFETNEGALIYDGPVQPGFTGQFLTMDRYTLNEREN
jgi:hypothetical protein